MPELLFDKAECGGRDGGGVEAVTVPEHWVPERVCIFGGRQGVNGVQLEVSDIFAIWSIGCERVA